MAPMSRLSRSLSVMQTRVGSQLRRSTKRLRGRRRRVANPPATAVVTSALRHGVFEIRLDGGKRRNVLGRTTIDRIEQLVQDPPSGTKVIVITAAPPDFCAGYDLMEASRGTPESLIAHEANFAPLRSSAVPILVALQGNVIGGGLELALSADIRIASPETTFAIPASQMGLVYSDAGVRLIVNILGESVARSMFLGGSQLSAGAALAHGVVLDIVGRDQLRHRTLELAASIAAGSSLATSGNRKVLDVVTGRSVESTEGLRLQSFAPRGDLDHYIRQFVLRRSQSSRPPPS